MIKTGLLSKAVQDHNKAYEEAKAEVSPNVMSNIAGMMKKATLAVTGAVAGKAAEVDLNQPVKPSYVTKTMRKQLNKRPTQKEVKRTISSYKGMLKMGLTPRLLP